MLAAEYVAPESLRLRDLEDPEPEPGQVVVEVASCGICGSDLHSFQHGFAARPGQVLGHEFAGRVIAGGAEAGIDPGARVCVRPLIPCGTCEACSAGRPQQCQRGFKDQIGYAARGAFAERVLVPRATLGETVFELPESVDYDAGALVEPLAVGLHAVRGLDPQEGETAAVFGLGTIGLGAVRFLTLAGVRVVGFDPSALRRQRAVELGAKGAHDPLAEDAVGVMQAITGRGPQGSARADLAIECAGVPAAAADALKMLKPGGRVTCAAIYARPVELDLNAIVQKEIRISGSLAYADEFSAVIDHLEAGDIDADRLVSHHFPLQEIEAAFAAQLDREQSLKVIVNP